MGYEQITMPVQRVDGLVITEAGDDVLIYDQNTYSLHTLNNQSYQVWQHCDGIATVDSVAVVTGMSVDVVKRALTQLEDALLIEAPLDESLRSNESRRSIMKKASIVAIPAIVSVSVPLAQAAASCSTTKFCGVDAGPGELCTPGLGAPVCGTCVRQVTFYEPTEGQYQTCTSADTCPTVGSWDYDLCVAGPGGGNYCARYAYQCLI